MHSACTLSGKQEFGTHDCEHETRVLMVTTHGGRKLKGSCFSTGKQLPRCILRDTSKHIFQVSGAMQEAWGSIISLVLLTGSSSS